ncbi:ankyrin repeat domain-containing protein [Streptomyces sp. NPDC048636]|uniref:ankyrin repeat domain-containing protein n=1 Tax=Streptomyces sp. NPDC048636 TaxID=3155762 RepID=UPI003446B8C4
MSMDGSRDTGERAEGWNPRAAGAELFEAVDRDDAAAVRSLLAGGADIEAADPRSPFHDGETVLIGAAGRGAADTVRLLLDAGAEVNARSASGWTALMRACDAGHLDCARVLLDAGAAVGARNDEGYTAHGRTAIRNTELIRLLEERGAD